VEANALPLSRRCYQLPNGLTLPRVTGLAAAVVVSANESGGSDVANRSTSNFEEDEEEEEDDVCIEILSGDE